MIPLHRKIFFLPVHVKLLFVCCICALKVSAGTGDSVLANVQKISFTELMLPQGAKDSSSFIIPFSRAGNLLLIKAKADSVEGNFILDTGCPNFVLNITYFRNYPTTTDPTLESLGMTGNSTATEQISIRDFKFGAIQEYNVKANLANLGTIENSRGVKILGLVGMQFLTDTEMIIDYENNRIYFHLIGKKEASTYNNVMLQDTAAYHTMPFEITENRIIVKTTMAGKKLRFLIDCAAETNILDSRLPDKVFSTLAITGRVSLVGVGNKKVEAVTGTLEIFSIGNRTITDMKVLVTNLEKTCLSYGGCVDGVLGLNDLTVTKIGFNFAKRKMYLWK